MNRTRQPLGLVLAALLLVAGGCDAVSTKERIARDLYKRVQERDCLAYFELEQRTDKNEKAAAAYLGLAIQQHLGSHCRADDLLALRAYAPAVGKLKEVDFNTGLILLGRNQFASAEQAFIRAAGGEKKDGLTRAMVKLAQIYDAGLAGFPNSESLAGQYYQAAADRGELHAATRLGLRMIEGRGMPRNVERGVEILEHAAQRGNRDARYELFKLADSGRLGDGNRRPELAAKWLGAAALIDGNLNGAFEAYLRELHPNARATVTKEVEFFRTLMKEVWKDDDYDKPIAPRSLLSLGTDG